ncbi:MAG: hypothetical protein HRU12_23045, partial [Phaeodactylibacter sp.]|nr:hypothetical protein [Phaeodactylibacter sp.]
MMKYTTLLLAFLLVGIQSVLAQDCTNDTQSPTVACIDFLSVNLDDFEGLFTLYPQDILAGATDNCTDTLDFQISEGNTPNDPPSTTSLEFSTPGTYTPVLWAIDEAGNFSQCWMTLEIQGADPDCEEDTTAPNIICFTGQTVTLDENTGTVTVPAQFIVQSVWDDCTDTLSLTIGLDDALPEPPTATAHVFDAVGTYAVVVWAEDTAGNWSYCVSALTVEDDAPECDDDTEAPLVACLDVLSVELNPNGTIEIFGTDLLAAVTDNCSEDFDYFIGTTDGGNDLPATISLVYTDPGVYYPAVYVVDEAGNWNNCWTEVIVGGTNADCENDTEAPNIICFTGQEVLLSENTGTAIVPATFFIYNVFDNCTDSIAITMSLDEPLNSPPASTAETFDQAGTYAVYVAAEDEAGNWAYCATTVIVEGGISGAYAISGHVVRDLDDNCQVDSTDMPLQGWGVSLWTGDNYDIPVGQGLSAVTGLYEIQFSEPQGGFTDSIQVRIDVAANLPQGCPLYHNYAAQDLVAGVALTGDFTVTLVEDCPAMQVDLATPFLRRCFDSQYYIQYCNYGSETAVDAYIELELDDYLVYQSSTVSPAAIDGQVYTFDVGDVAPGECGSIGLVVYVDC